METLDAYLERLASDAAVPGGGSAAAVVISLGAALIAMVGRIAGRNPKNAPVAQELEAIVVRSDELRRELEAARLRDETAFGAVVAAQALPTNTQEERAARRRALDASLEKAAEAPLQAAGLSVRVLDLALSLLEFPTKALSSDVGSAAEFAHAGLASCAYNVRINHRFMHDAPAIARQEESLGVVEVKAQWLADRVRSKIDRDLRE